MIESNELRGSLVNSNEGKGALGFKGERGYSAYEIAVQNGYQGTEQEWIDHFGLDLTGYLKTSDIVNNAWQGGTQKPLSAETGKSLNNYINEVSISIGLLENLETTVKTSIVNAINELYDMGVYSTTEQVIGTWIDGKPIYRVVKNIGNLPNNGRKEVSFSGIIPTGVVCTKIYGIAERASESVIDYVNLKDVCSLLMYRTTNNTLYVDTSEDRSNYTGYVVLEYTKTTD